MRYCLLPILLFFGLSCRNTSTEQSSNTAVNDSSSTALPTQPDTLCFQQVMNRDTTTVRLVINGKLVTGFLDINRYEKDRARGPFQGTMQASHIQVDWSRSGEGITEKYSLNLIRSGDTLRWREGAFIKNPNGTGWIAADTSSGFLHELVRTDCAATSLP